MGDVCPHCQVAPGDLHLDRCPAERCADCGGQRLICGHEPAARLPWSGDWPGVAECREFGWYVRKTPILGWVRCDPDHPDAEPDLHRLFVDAIWDRAQARFVRSAPVFRTGDHVFHAPSGETWVVAAVFPENDRLSWCGWPEGSAKLSDCQLVRAATDAEHWGLLEALAAIEGNDHRARYAKRLLETHPALPGGPS